MKRTGKRISCWGDVINKWKAPVVFLRHSELGGWEIQVCVSGDDRVGPHSEVAQMVGSLIFDCVGLRKSGRFQVRGSVIAMAF